MSQMLPEKDDTPAVFVDPEGFFTDLTDDEAAEGNHLGHTIDVDDDDDNGL
jgi:hypothetical protein